MWRSVLLGVVLAGLLAGCSLGGGSGGVASTNKYLLAHGAVRGSFNLHDPGLLLPTVTASQVWCDWARDKRHIVLHIRFRNTGQAGEAHLVCVGPCGRWGGLLSDLQSQGDYERSFWRNRGGRREGES